MIAVPKELSLLAETQKEFRIINYMKMNMLYHTRTFNSDFTCPLPVCVSIIKNDFQGRFAILFKNLMKDKILLKWS